MERWRRNLEEYFKDNRGIYIFIIALFTGGVLAGALALRGLEKNQLLQLNHFFAAFIDELSGGSGGSNQGEIFKQALSLNFRYLLLTWSLGLFTFGFPLVAGLVGLRGFSLGFTVGFLVSRDSLRGVLFAAGAILPHNLILVPALLVAGATAFSLSLLRLRCYLEKRPSPLREQIASYSLIFILVGLLMGAAILIEAYISPAFVTLLIPSVQ